MKSLSSLFFFLESVMILTGIIIGAGVFVLPYVGYFSGLISIIFWLILSFFIITYLHLAFGEIVLKTDKEHRLIGYANYYLGKKAKYLISLTTFFTFSFSLLIYLLLSAQFLNNLLEPYISLPFPYLFFSLWFILNLMTLFPSQEKVASLNFLFSFLILFIFFFIILFYYPYFQFHNLNFFPIKDSSYFLNYLLKIFLPYGIAFFALNGMAGVPELLKNFKKRNLPFKKAKEAIILGTILPLIFYFSFILFVDGICGKNVSKEAINCLKDFLGYKIVFLGSCIGLLAVITSYIVFSLYLKNTFLKDFNFPKSLAQALIIFGPLIFYLLNLKNIISLVSFLGGLVGGMEGLMILFIFKKLKEKIKEERFYSLNFNQLIFLFLLIILILGALCQTFIVPLIN
jgi:amino acid permease